MDLLPKDSLLNCLQTGELEMQGQFMLGSNYTLLVQVVTASDRFVAVCKPVRGERPLWDFPFGSLEKREAAAYLVSDTLGWDLVPPVVFRESGPFGPGSVQVFIEHDPDYHYFTFEPEDVQRLRPAVVFDLLINNADRKGGHFLKDSKSHIWLIDHGLCFHRQDKYRTVVWDFAGSPIPNNLLTDIDQFLRKLAEDNSLTRKLGELILPEELDALKKRGTRLLRDPIFPEPDETERQFPWPPV